MATSTTIAKPEKTVRKVTVSEAVIVLTNIGYNYAYAAFLMYKDLRRKEKPDGIKLRN